jgi:hypothetical protein
MTVPQILAAVTSSAHTPQTRQPGIETNARVAGLCAVLPRDGISWTQRSQPSPRADRASSLDSGQSGRSPAGFLRALSGPGRRPSTQSEGIYARVANQVFPSVGAVASASRRPMTTRDRRGWAIVPSQARPETAAPKLDDRPRAAPFHLENVSHPRWNFLSHHLSQSPSRIFSSRTVGSSAHD